MLKRVADYLFEPSAQITNEGLRRTARITSVLCFVTFLQRFLDNIAVVTLTAFRPSLLPLLLVTPLLFAIYLLSRTRHVRYAADGLVWLFFCFILTHFFAMETRSTDVLIWLLIPLTLASLLQSVQRTFIVWVAAVSCIIIFSMRFVTPSPIHMVRSAGSAFIIGLLLLTAASIRERDRRLIEKQNQELELQKLALEDTNEILEKTVVGQSTRLRQNSAELAREKQSRTETEHALQKKQRLEGIGLLSAGIAHDINNLLTGIGGHISIAAHKVGKDSSAQSNIQKAAAQVIRTSTMTRQLLAYVSDNQNTTAQVDIYKVVVDICALLERVIDKNVTLIHDKGADRDQPMNVWGDSAQLQQVVMNLIVNAADAITNETNDSSGVVTVELAPHALRAADPLFTKMLNGQDMIAGDYFELTVRDTGCGMDSETVNRIFEPFFTTKQTGHGLGLSAVSGILRQHHAGLIVTSEAGVGTLFRVFFPAYVSTAPDDEVMLTPALQTDSKPNVTGLNILLIDDDESVQEVTTELLEIRGHTVVVAENGQLGIRALESSSTRIDLIWLDLDMPVMGGIPTFLAIREISPEMPIVLHTGNSLDEVNQLLETDASVVFLPKPYTNERMWQALDEAMAFRVPAYS